MNDPEPTPISKTQQRMALAFPGEESALSGSVCRPERNGIFFIHCFICGSGVTPGKELSLQVKYQRKKDGPFFPFLQGQDPAPGAPEIGPDGDALVCAVCHCFLREQWNSFERNRTPVEKRMYWLKRPYQCDLRNITYDLERRMSASNYDANESDISSFSDNDLSEQDLDLSACVMNSNNATGFRASDKASREGSRKITMSVKSSPESVRYPTRVCTGQDLPKSERRATKLINHASQSSASMALQQYDSLSIRTPLQDNGIITCDKQWIHASTGDSDAPDSCDINITSDDERERAASTHLDVERSQAAKCHSSFSADECACYICGSRLSAGGHFRVFVQKQERASSEPFFPFLWLHTPPPGAVPLSLGGYTLICTTCHSSLMQQWQGFELADVPVLQRLYVVPLSTGAATPLSPPAMNECGDGQPKIISLPSMPQNRRETCYLCGQDCGREVRMAYTHAGASKARSAMYFPFINLLPCPPSAQSIRNGRVYCCVKCHSILEGIWAKYCLCLSEELITSVTTFLERYHLAMGRGGVLVSPPRGPLSTPSQTATTTASHTSICYLCGEELSGGTEYQLHVNPPGRCGEREPFFSLSNSPPSRSPCPPC